MREFDVRLTVRTNDREDEAERGEPYYDDAEMSERLGVWIAEALHDRDDSPYVHWGEITLRVPPTEHEHVFLGDHTDPDRLCIKTMDCSVTWAQRREGAGG